MTHPDQRKPQPLTPEPLLSFDPSSPPPLLTADLPGVGGRLKSVPEDFEVEEALVLQHWHGLTLAQVGASLGRTPAAVAGLLKRGLKRLRELLEGRG